MKPVFYMTLTAALIFTACKHSANTPLQDEFKGLAGKWKLTAIYQGYSGDNDLKIWRAVVEDKYLEFNKDGSMTGDQYNAFKVGDFYSDGQLTEDSVIFTYRNDVYNSDTTRYLYTQISDELILYPLLTCIGICGMKYVRVSGK